MRQILFEIGRKTFTETFQMLQQAYGEDCLSRTQCHGWYQRFKSGRTYLNLFVFLQSKITKAVATVNFVVPILVSVHPVLPFWNRQC